VLNALFELLNVVAGFLVVMSVWLGIQAFVRRRSGCGKDRDMLDFMLNGCGGCANGATCGRKGELGGHHEPL
jgi:hypothetical protein